MKTIMFFRFEFVLLFIAMCSYCDKIDKYATPFYRNSYKKHSWVETRRSGDGRGGYFGKPKEIIHEEIISTIYSFKLIRKLNSSTGLFLVLINDVMQNTEIIIKDIDLSDRVTGDVFHLQKKQTLWCIGTQDDKSTGKSWRKFTMDRNVVLKFVKEK